MQTQLGITTRLRHARPGGGALGLRPRRGDATAGGIEQLGTPAEIYGAPATRFVAEFIGTMNRLESRVAEGETGAVDINGTIVPVDAVRGRPAGQDVLRPAAARGDHARARSTAGRPRPAASPARSPRRASWAPSRALKIAAENGSELIANVPSTGAQAFSVSAARASCASRPTAPASWTSEVRLLNLSRHASGLRPAGRARLGERPAPAGHGPPHRGSRAEVARLVIVGAGIVGTSLALAAVEQGHEVVQLERDAEPRGATVRSFGLLWISGRAPGASSTSRSRAACAGSSSPAARPRSACARAGRCCSRARAEEVALLEQVCARPDAADARALARDRRGGARAAQSRARRARSRARCTARSTRSSSRGGSCRRCAGSPAASGATTFLPGPHGRRGRRLARARPPRRRPRRRPRAGLHRRVRSSCTAPIAWPPRSCARSGCRWPRPRRGRGAADDGRRERRLDALLPGLRPARARAAAASPIPRSTRYEAQLLLAPRRDGAITIGDTHAFDAPGRLRLRRRGARLPRARGGGGVRGARCRRSRAAGRAPTCGAATAATGSGARRSAQASSRSPGTGGMGVTGSQHLALETLDALDL